MSDFHLHHHKEEHFRASDTIRDIVIGMSDGLTVPFALAAGLSGAVDSNSLVITAGIAEVVAGSIAMGLGGYLAGRTDVEHYKAELKREYEEVERVPEREKQEVKDVFAEYGLSPKLQEEVAEELSKNKEMWVQFMMRFELGLEEPHPNRATKSALTIGISYVLGGIVPLLAYFFTSSPQDGLLYSAITTTLFLFAFGYVKTRLTGESPLKGAFKTVLIGVLAAGCAYAIAKAVGG